MVFSAISPLKDTVSVVMEGTGNKSVIADKAKRLASVSIQHRQSWDAVVMVALLR